MHCIKFIPFAVFILSFGTVCCQPEIISQKCFGTSGTDFFNDAIATSDGGFAVVAEFGGMDGIMEGQDSLLYPATLMKFDSDLNLSWMRNYGGTNSGSGFNKLIEIVSGHYIIAGVTSSTDGDFPDNHGNSDLFLLKTDLLGNKIFSKCYGSPGFDDFESFIPVFDGGYLITGRSYSIGGDIPIHYGDGMASDAFVMKVSADGAVEWTKVFGGSNSDGPLADPVEINPGRYFITIGSNSNDYDLSDSGITGGKRWIIILNNDGNVLDENFASSETNISGFDGQTYFNSGEIVVTGTGYAESIYDPTIPEHAGYEGAVVRFDTNMNVTYMKQWGGLLSDYFRRSCIDLEGNYFFLGYSNSMDGDLPSNYNNGDAFDYWLLKTDANFNTHWSINFGGSDGCGDLNCSTFHGQIVNKGNRIYAFIMNVVPETLPDYDIECGSLGPGYTDAWLVEFDVTNNNLNSEGNVQEYMIYPNPAFEEMVVHPTFFSDNDVDIEIMNLNGGVVYNRLHKENRDIFINTECFPVGLYIISILREGNKLFYLKVLIL